MTTTAEPTYRQLDHWARRGWLHPIRDIPDTAWENSPDGKWIGSGHPREWPAEEIRVARIIARLRAAGIEAPVAAKAAREPQGRPAQLGPGVWLVVWP